MKATVKAKIQQQAHMLATQAASKWSNERILAGLAYESLITSFGVSHDAATHIIKHEMTKRRLSHG